MDKWDRDNLNFLLNVDDETFDDFVAQSSADDIDYAIELIQTHRAELMTRELELQDELADENDLDEAQAVLAKFRL